MKKSLAIILGVVMLVALAATAYAETEFKLGGDARVRGAWTMNYDFSDATPDNDNRWYDYRIRISMDAKADGGSAVHTRLVATDWNHKWGSDTASQAAASGSSGATVEADYAYIDVPLTKDWMLTAGKVVVNWGNKFMAWDQRAMRIILGTKFGDTTVKFFTQKNVDTLNTAGDENLDDYDKYSALAIYQVKDLTLGGIYVYSADNRAADDLSGSTFDIYGNYKSGNFGIFGELVYNTGDLFKTGVDDDDNNMGGFAHATYKMGNTTLHGAFAFTNNGFDADDDFTPTFLYGTSQQQGLMNFGNGGDTMAYVLAVDHNVNANLNLMAKLAYADISEYVAGEADIKLTELDLGLTYKINKSTTYNIDFAYGKADIDGVDEEDAAIALAHKIQINF